HTTPLTPFPTRRSSDLLSRPGRRPRNRRSRSRLPHKGADDHPRGVADQPINQKLGQEPNYHYRAVKIARSTDAPAEEPGGAPGQDRKSTRLNSSHGSIS